MYYEIFQACKNTSLGCFCNVLPHSVSCDIHVYLRFHIVYTGRGGGRWERGRGRWEFPSLEPRLSIPDFVSQLGRKIQFFSKAAKQNPERKAWVLGQGFPYMLSHTPLPGDVLRQSPTSCVGVPERTRVEY